VYLFFSLLPTSEDPNHKPAATQRIWLITAAAILITGAAVRVYKLGLVPLHHDEGVNGKFLLKLVNEGFYQYDPQNYHGPTLYYFAAVVPWVARLLFGKSFAEAHALTDVTVRLTTAAFGIATIWLVLTLRRRCGTLAALAGAALLALSPGAIYISRYFIHETLFVFFTVGLVVAALRFYETAKPLYLMLSAAAAAFLFATKETAIISVAVLLLALAVTTIFVRLRNGHGHRAQFVGEELSRKPADFPSLVERLGGPSSLIIASAAALSLFLIIEILFYSSFFTNYPNGLYDALKTLQFWTQTGVKVHVHPWSTYLLWMWQGESTILLLGLIGLGFVLWRNANSFVVFVALYGFGLFAAYSLIPYKTPWLMLNFVVPLAVISGYALQQIYELAAARKLRIIAVALGAGAFAFSSYQALTLNFLHYDDPAYAYVYVHTERDIFPLLAQIDRIAQRARTGEATPVAIVSPDYWPLPWYLRNYSHVTYYGKVTPFTEPIVIASPMQVADIAAMSGLGYRALNTPTNPAGTYTLRPGIELLILVRSDLTTE
jgi:uncharacterized protein (TIGR03663 family)